MKRRIKNVLEKHDDPAEILGVSSEADDEEIRRTYLEKVRQFPPDRAPEAFERIRDAYDQLRDPRLRARLLLDGPNPLAPLTELVDAYPVKRRYAGLGLWMAVIKEK